MTGIATITYCTDSFKADVVEALDAERLRMSAPTRERTLLQFDAIGRNCWHAERATGEGDRVRHLIRAAYVCGKLGETFGRIRRDGWVSRSEALCRVIENCITGEDAPV